MTTTGEPDQGPWPVWIADSYFRAFGSNLADPTALYTADFVVLAHDAATDPLFVYANLAGQRLWQRDWAHFIGTPSRLSAPEEARAERSQALASDGVVTGYSGVRIDSAGRRFHIHDASVWPVIDDNGKAVGQAATFDRWTHLD